MDCRRAISLRRSRRPDVKAYRAARAAEYNARPEVRERLRRRRQEPEYKARKTECNNRPEYKQRRREYYARYQATYEVRTRRALLRRLRDFGVTQDWYDERYAAGCPICLRSFDGRRAQLDHDRSCCARDRACPQCFRGLICQECNRDGLVGIDYLIRVGGLDRAIAYARSGGRLVGLDGEPMEVSD